jgi:aerobic carbon-monoxide dehydrogenase medium subunit
VKPAPFAYHRPSTLADTLDLLGRHGDDARVLAGGQSLVPAMNMRLATPRVLIDINRVPGLDDIRVDGDTLVLGALTRLDTAERSPLVARHAPLIAAALPHVGHLAIRTRGTVGGSIALADPAAELPACAVAQDAVVRTARIAGGREIAAADFFRGIYTTALDPGEVLTALVLPLRPPGWRSSFQELARRHGDYALAGLAAQADVVDGRFRDLRLVYLGVGVTPVRARGAERVLLEDGPTAATMAEAARRLDDDLDPPSDVHASVALRRQLARVLLERTVQRLAQA